MFRQVAIVLAALVACAAAVPLPDNLKEKHHALDTDAAKHDRVFNLPGLHDKADYRMYSGYITVHEDSNAKRRLFYWFFTSQNDAKNDPVVMWLNGGPGCSSLNGALEQHGPFRPNSDGSLTPNSESWNRIANTLYIESPAGVGFSYSNNSADYKDAGDKRSADDLYNFMQGFFDRFPEFSKNPMWITGESYGGHYVPTTSLRFVQGNDAKEGKHIINFKGFMVGNAWTVAAIDNREGALDFWYGHGMISEETHNAVQKACNFSVIGPLKDHSAAANDECDMLCDDAMAELGRINIYDVYEDVCVKNGNAGASLLKAVSTSGSSFARFAHKLATGPAPPCIDDYTSTYLNQKSVYEALHVEVDYPWTDCSGIVNSHYSREDLLSSMVPVYKQLLGRINILVYSGDVDGIVPFTGSRAWIKQLNLPVSKPFRSWVSGQQTGGYVTEYEGFTFATVRDAGHMCAGTQPSRTFDMFERFINGKQI